MSIPSETLTPEAPQPQSQAQAVPAPAPAPAPSAVGPVKRSSRRANTAERRATHNAVERARRETLNGRFLDLAAMLPNLAAVRRPSKSAIVNSSIALIHNQSRARVIAARQLRLVHAEAAALRNELNEWRARNGLPRVEEPARSPDFASLLAVEDVDMGEEMVLGNGRRSMDADGYGDDDIEDDDEPLVSPEAAQAAPAHYAASMHYPSQQQIFEQQKAAMAHAQAQLAQVQAQPRYSPSVAHHQHSQSQPAMLFPADLYTDYQATSWSQKAISALTPPGSAHGHPQTNKPSTPPSTTSTAPSPYANTANNAFLVGHQQQALFAPHPQARAYLGVGEDDQSDGSSHFSGVSDLGSLDHHQQAQQPFSFGLSSNPPAAANLSFNLGYGNAYNAGLVNGGMMNGMGIMLPPSPAHTGSPVSISSQSRRPSVPGPLSATGSAKSSPGPYGVPLMI